MTENWELFCIYNPSLCIKSTVCSRKMQISEAADLATMGQSGFDICNVNLKTEAEESLNSDAKICCPCGTSLPIDSMVQVIISFICYRFCLTRFGAEKLYICISSVSFGGKQRNFLWLCLLHL